MSGHFLRFGRIAKSKRQVVIERTGWAVLLLMISPGVIPAFEELRSGYWYFAGVVSVIIAVTLIGLVCRWGLIVLCTLGFAYFGLLPKVNGDTVSDLQSGIACAIAGALIGGILDVILSQDRIERPPGGPVSSV